MRGNGSGNIKKTNNVVVDYSFGSIGSPNPIHSILHLHPFYLKIKLSPEQINKSIQFIIESDSESTKKTRSFHFLPSRPPPVPPKAKGILLLPFPSHSNFYPFPFPFFFISSSSRSFELAFFP